MAKKWVKLYCKKWLDGTMSYELTDAQVGVWSKLLALAGEYADYNKSDGIIPLELEGIQKRIKSAPRTFKKAIDRLIETDRIQMTDAGIQLVNFTIYNPARSELWDAEHPDRALKRKRDYKGLRGTTSDGIDRDRERDKDRDGDIRHPPIIPPQGSGDINFERVREAYERDIGMFPPLLGKEVQDALARWPVEWIMDALKIAVEKNVRNWKYVAAICKRWEGEGRGTPDKAPLMGMGRTLDDIKRDEASGL